MRISDWSSDVCSSDLAVQMALQNAGFVYTERRRYRLFGLVETGFDRLAHGERQVIRELGAVGSYPVPASTRNVTLAVKYAPAIRMIGPLDTADQEGIPFQRPASATALKLGKAGERGRGLWHE